MRVDDKFNVVYARYNKYVLEVCKRYVKHDDDAYDLMQDTFVKISRVIDKIDINSCTTYINRIAKNTAIDAIRRNRGVVLSSMDSDSLVYHEVENMTHDVCCYEHDDFSTHVRSKLEELGGKYSSIFNMFVFDDMQHKEIAEKMSMNISTVRGDLFKSRKRIKELVEF